MSEDRIPLSNLNCYLATKSLFVGTKDNVCQCCIQGSVATAPNWNDVDDLNTWFKDHNTFNEIRSDLNKGIQSKHCQRCWNYENNGLPSNRNYANELGAGYSLDPEIEHLDIRMSNKCNLRCRMCNAGASSLIEDTVNQMLSEGVSNNSYLSKQYDSTNTTNINKLIKLIAECKTLKSIEFAGGEPFIMPEVEYILSQLVEQKRTNVRISLITNVTSTKNRIFELLKKFSNVSITCSIDGVDKYLEYQRYPVKWKTVERNFLQMYNEKGENIEFTILPSISQLTLLGLDKFFEYFKKFNVKIGFNQVIDPSYLDFRLIPLDHRNEFLDKVPNIDYSFLNGHLYNSYKHFFEKSVYEHRDITDKERILLRDAVKFWNYKSSIKYEELYPWANELLTNNGKPCIIN